MNLFILAMDPVEIAKAMMNKHIVKIILEAANVVAVAMRLVDPKNPCNALPIMEKYGRSHHNHPVCVWCRESRANYLWTLELLDAMHDEWRFRFGHPETRVHKSYAVALELRRHVPHEHAFARVGRTPFALVMPDEYKAKDGDPVASYRAYYMSPDKRRLANWGKLRDRPSWYTVESI